MREANEGKRRLFVTSVAGSAPPVAATGSASSSSAAVAETRHSGEVFSLACKEELRFEVSFKHTATLELVDGKAEVFGTPLVKHRKYTFSGVHKTVFSWEGARVRLSGEYDGAYVSSESPMTTFLNVHSTLEELRDHAYRTDTQGPVVVLAGPVDTGKTTLSRILTGLACRSGRTVGLVDLDLGQGQLTPPGTISAVAMTEPFPVENEELEATPLAYYHGHISPGERPELFQLQVEELAAACFAKSEEDKEWKHGGLIINTCGWVDKLGLDLLKHHISAFRASMVLVMGDDRLLANLVGQFPDTVIRKLNKPGGAVSRDTDFRINARSLRFRQYFYGVDGTLMASPMSFPLHEVQIFSVGGAQAPSSALPIGATSMADPLKLIPQSITPDLKDIVLGVTHAESPDELLTASMAGVLLVTGVDLEKGLLHVRSPSPDPPPCMLFLKGTLKWMDS